MYQAHGWGHLKTPYDVWVGADGVPPVALKPAILSPALSGWQAPVLKQLGLVQNRGLTGHRGGALERRDVE